MFRFENPLDPSKDGKNPFIDGARFYIRNNLANREKIEKNIPRYVAAAKQQGVKSAIIIYEKILKDLRIGSSEMTKSDDHEFLTKIDRMLEG